MASTFPPETPDWCNLKVIHRGTLPPRSSFFNHQSEPDALEYDSELSVGLSLNGVWKFHHANSPFEAPESFMVSGFDTSTWSNINVPAMWQMEGFAKPQYLNSNYGIPVDAPNVPFDNNQTGSYVRQFKVPEKFANSHVRLRFEGVDSAFHCWLNGVELGYSQGSRNPSEFDITHLLRPDSTLCVRVYQYCDGTYIEGQDQWRMSGIFRDVHLIAFPKSHIRDFRVLTDFDTDYVDARLVVDVDITGEGEPVHLTLYDETKSSIIADAKEILTKPNGKVEFSIPVNAPQKWSAESPTLYHLVLRYGSQVIAQRVGFRKVEIKNGLIMVNGRRVVFKGANRHEHHPQSGRTVPYDFLRQDLLTMKRHNLNAIRTCHQPSDPRLYDLADELGLWIMDEADLECHGYDTVENRKLSPTERQLTYDEHHTLSFGRAGRWLSDNLDWKDAYVDRIQQMASRDKNHPSVIMWSLGNEAFQGRNFQFMYDWVKSYDPSRPVHYEGDTDARIVDVVSTMYPPLDKMTAFARNWDGQKPLLLCEFIHAMGNGPRNIKEYIDLFYEHPCLQGGWVWEWANHGLLTTAEDRTPYYGYGGDFGESHHDGHFVIDGVVNSEHRPAPGLLEYQKALEPVQLVPGSTIELLRIQNRYDFIDLDHLDARYKFVGDGDPIEGCKLELPSISAGQIGELKIPELSLDKLPAGKEYFLEVGFSLKESTPWGKSGDEIAWFQVPISKGTTAMPLEDSAVTIEKSGQTVLKIKSGETDWTFDLVKGRIASWEKRGENVLISGPELSIYRAPTDNDLSAGKEWVEKEVKHVQPHTRKVIWSVDNATGVGYIHCTQRLAPVYLEWGIETTTVHTFRGSRLQIHVSGVPKGYNLPKTFPRVGMQLSLVPSYEQVTWFGRGPGESYKDKKHAQKFGKYMAAVDDLSPEYEFPQESGNHVETRWVEFRKSTRDDSSSIKASFVDRPQGFDFQASRYAVQDVEKAQHPYELKKYRREELIVRLDHDHHGLGSESCGPPTLPEYALEAKPFDFTIELE